MPTGAFYSWHLQKKNCAFELQYDDGIFSGDSILYSDSNKQPFLAWPYFFIYSFAFYAFIQIDKQNVRTIFEQ